MAESLVVSGLVSKRSEVAGQIISYQAEITRLQESLSHLDGSIKLFAPEYDLRTIKSKRTNTRNQYFVKGEAQRLTLDVMREAGKPLNNLEITAQLLERKGIEATEAITARIQKNVFAVIHRLEARHIVREIDNGAGVMKWEIV
ncbi:MULTISPECIES: hypothetical protein [unclassified Acidovorax]|jgi:hypothetical protein|uniref:hypothetical protein n=1 Tax=unclassified Acidovorax TaxID=2684926 RepID=UPI0011B20C91|nr:MULTISPECIES: hypothetical protein [unclassified Acidovorax]MBL7091149.1 hypothetical protein [Acidovorax sp.]